MKFLGKEVSSPIVLPSGILGLSASSMNRVIKSGAGVVTTKSISLHPRKGHEGPIYAEYNGGIINAVGLSNSGIELGLEEVAEFKKINNAPVNVSVFGSSAEEFVKLSEYVNYSPADFIELNLSCPNVEDEFSRPFATSEERVFQVVEAVKKVSKIPVIAKLSPNVADIRPIAIAAEKAGADALTMINTVGPGMMIDIVAMKPVLKNKVGGMSGPAVKPLAVKLVYETYKVVKIPIIGMGGITYGEDAIEMMMAGALMVGVGSAVYYRGQDVFKLVLNEINKFMTAYGYNGYEELVGKAHHG